MWKFTFVVTSCAVGVSCHSEWLPRFTCGLHGSGCRVALTHSADSNAAGINSEVARCAALCCGRVVLVLRGVSWCSLSSNDIGDAGAAAVAAALVHVPHLQVLWYVACLLGLTCVGLLPLLLLNFGCLD